VLKKLAKKYGLKKTGPEKLYIYIEDFTKMLWINLIITEKMYSHRRYRILL